MAPVDLAIKELFKEELQEVRDFQTKQDERFTEMEKALQDLSAKVEERRVETGSVKEEVDKLRQEHEAHDERTKSIEGLDPASLKDRLDRLENDEDGLGGLKQVHDKLETATKDILDLQPKMAEVTRIGSAAKSRTDEFDLLLKQLGRLCEELQATSTSLDERLGKVEISSGSVSVAQQALEDAVARKYETMWQDVLHAIEEMKASQLEELKKESERKRENSRTNAEGMVSYALNLLGASHAERKKLEIGKDLVTAWRHQTWASARRRQGLWRLHCLFQRRTRESVGRWNRAASIAHLSDSLRKDTVKLLPDVDQVLKDSGLAERCDKLQSSIKELKELNDVSVSVQSLEERLKQDELQLTRRLDALQATLLTKEKHEASISEVHDRHREVVGQTEEALQKRIEEYSERFAALEEGVATCSKTKDVQAILRDTLLMWNSIKQLDSAKADKKDLDAFAVSSNERTDTSVRRIDGLEAEVVEHIKHEVAGVQTRWEHLEATVNDNSKQFGHWEKMWEKLAGYVEDLVTKVSDLQAAASAPPAPPASVAASKLGSVASTLRPASVGARSRPPSAERGMRGRPDVPLLPVHPNVSGIDCETTADGPTFPVGNAPGMLRSGAASGSTDSLESRLIWASSAKGIVDQTFSHAAPYAGTPKLRPLARPKSATVRRSLDRARD
eukprot:TRINITY_DN51142_c0_g1_i1.p1 TRINITY_DN51142_c0_g1~~TRINITY_DN51142_c0_g1_i1.p1  ORF type:complete len:675 (+),score=204.25 TRINITY_DN51142_c0_g1_i1:102-2126(+)